MPQVISLCTLCAGSSLFSSGSIWASIVSYHQYWHLLPHQSHLGGSTRLLRDVSVATGFGSEARAHLYSGDLEHLALTWADACRLQCPPCMPCPHQVLLHIQCDMSWSHTARAIYISCGCPGNLPSLPDWLTGAYGSWAAAQVSLSIGDSAAGNLFWYARRMQGAFEVTKALWRLWESTTLRHISITRISWA